MDVRDTVLNLGSDGLSSRNRCVCIYRKFSLKVDVNNSHTKKNGTHVEDVEGPDEGRFPAGELCLVAARVDKSKNRIPFTLLDLHPDLRQRATIERIVSGVFRTVHRWFDSHRQLFNRLVYGVVKVFQSLPV